ncbi:hypothetical protein CALVIDRAFT_220342 [Calocera viscosa TUFC12733]|uniref:Uncharacterized protein n=1 Tax=Calocera viscosa (strain TUFC12733) TaxID=1330018 RepID=A0A167RJJ0_CALVF|nr:hypothetical protein CALVIDRAFT_220342 [Calocera viscosa TUFC12733]
MLFSAFIIIAVTASTVSGLAIKARDTCTYLCPPTDTAGEALVDGGPTEGVLACGYDLYPIGNGEEAFGTTCDYDLTTGAYYAGYGNCPSQASVTYSCPPYDSAGEALVDGGPTEGVLACGYDLYPIGNGEEAFGTTCDYDITTGAYYAGYGNCPSTAAC